MIESWSSKNLCLVSKERYPQIPDFNHTMPCNVIIKFQGNKISAHPLSFIRDFSAFFQGQVFLAHHLGAQLYYIVILFKGKDKGKVKNKENQKDVRE